MILGVKIRLLLSNRIYVHANIMLPFFFFDPTRPSEAPIYASFLLLSHIDSKMTNPHRPSTLPLPPLPGRNLDFDTIYIPILSSSPKKIR